MRAVKDILRDAKVGEFDHLAYAGKNLTIAQLKTDACDLIASRSLLIAEVDATANILDGRRPDPAEVVRILRALAERFRRGDA